MQTTCNSYIRQGFSVLKFLDKMAKPPPPPHLSHENTMSFTVLLQMSKGLKYPVVMSSLHTPVSAESVHFRNCLDALPLSVMYYTAEELGHLS